MSSRDPASPKFAYQFWASLFKRLVRDLSFVLVHRVGPDGLEGLPFHPRLLNGIVEWVGEESVKVYQGLDGFDCQVGGQANVGYLAIVVMDGGGVMPVGLVLLAVFLAHLGALQRGNLKKCFFN